MTAALGIRDTAVAAWRDLHAVLATGPPVACRADPEAWVGETAADRTEAASACACCHAADACSRFALANREANGVWAGTDYTPRPRRPRNAG